ncbi:aminotransferase class V-fold PLP-dependent enzyme [Cardinium endosymbiont of Culicoides punctatus]|uniref:aminotransferase class V-fold PLP-dependent enzyme n=1 Tax=Cardinium endosymbiont of Culicoides punctatus TaxID=2304601 RepID=UPI0010585B12|nr:SufS family cysteine desulfurase [Cardinium endosymbiont of Culicoides punctatus]TDG95480.1 Cysteine desulfurase [Cardinium endosymbiont of Culicoides punctatus]
MFASTHPLDIEQIRTFFPALHQQVYGRSLIYFDNAATTHKPLSVIQSAQHFYEQDNANVHRGMHALATRSAMAVEQTRLAVQKFIHAPDGESIVFTSGTTESINLIAATYGEMEVSRGDEILISEMEHHANLIPWQELCRKKQAILKFIPIDDIGQLDLTDLDKLITTRTKIVALSYVSNTLGTINPIKYLIDKAHQEGAVVVIDGAQAVAHLPVNVVDLDCDFFVFSAHKLYGLTGLGFLYGKKKWLEQMPPYKTGGGGVKRVTLTEAVYQDAPYKFEVGTLPLSAIISFSESIKFVSSIGYAKLTAHEESLLCYALAGLIHIPKIELVGTAAKKIGIIAFNIRGMHHLDVGLLLDAKGIAVRTGHCCTQPLMQRLGIEGVVRISFALYNTIEEIDLFLEALRQITHKMRY